jgi:nucleolar protein 53
MSRLAARNPPSPTVMAPAALKKSTASSTVGAPAQHSQSSRKGKKAWRKNVDIEDLEDKLEALREEERTLGYAFVPPAPIIVDLKLR